MGDADITTSQWKNVEVGRVVLFTGGEYYGKIAAIAEIIDHKRVCGVLPSTLLATLAEVDGQLTNDTGPCRWPSFQEGDGRPSSFRATQPDQAHAPNNQGSPQRHR